MYHSFIIHSSADGHLGSFHVLAIINSAVMNIGVHVCLSILVSLVCMAQQWECWVIWQFCFQHSVFLHSESPQDAQLGVVAVADNFLDCCIFCLLMWQVTFSICSHTRVLRI